MTNRLVAGIFGSIADMLELKGENPFRVRAYRRAARTIEGQAKDVSEMSREELLRIPGIGPDLADKIGEIIRTGRLEAHEALRKEVPEGLTELLSVPGLGPKTAKLLFEKMGVKGIGELERLARGHRLAGLPGIKEKTEENILKGIETFKKHGGWTPLGIALPLAEEILGLLRGSAPVGRVELAGSIRRRKDTVKDIDILCTSSDARAVMDAFVKLPPVERVLMRGPTKSSIETREGIHVDLRVVDEGSFGSALAYFTGSKAHNIRLRDMAVKAGLKLNEYGIFRGQKSIGGNKEEEIYEVLGLPFIPPEIREDSGEIEAALEGSLPRLVEASDIRGDLHVHTKSSDGRHSIEELVEVARAMDYRYIAVTDHSKGLGIAGGLSEERLAEEARKIDAFNKRTRGFRVLKGVEVDIRSDLTLDLGDEALSRLEIVVASVHSGFRQSREKLTARIVAAMRNPNVDVIAHPTGRLIGERDAYDVDMDEIFKTARDTGTALEINAYPMRLDLNDINARAAKEMSIPLVISTDTHLLSQFGYITYGVSAARRAWLEKGDILNTLDYKSLLRRLKK